MASTRDFEDFFESSRCGFVITDAAGVILRTNVFFASIFNSEPNNLKQKRFSDLLTIGGQIFWETHLSPLLKMQTYFDEAFMELKSDSGERIPVLINANEQKNETGQVDQIQLVVFKALDRYQYEQNIRDAKKNAEEKLANEREFSALREQFIAVLGHDLRNPLGAIMGGVQLLEHSNFTGSDAVVLTILKKSANRMHELISNIMDFARTRLGSGLSLKIEEVDIAPALFHVIEELNIAHRNKNVEINIESPMLIMCDKDRISQVFSNLLANAFTHGSSDFPIQINASNVNSQFVLSISNGGKKIPNDKIDNLFEPFTREGDSPSKQGLGLGLYISSQIAKAHNGTLTATSDIYKTSFILLIPGRI